MLDKMRYFIMRALRNMRQWPFLCAASVLTMAVALTMVATFFLVVVNVEQLTQRWSKDLQVVVYLDRAPAPSALTQMVSSIREMPEVAQVIHVTPAEAMAQFRQRLGENAALLQGVDNDILPGSLEIALHAQYQQRDGMDQLLARLKTVAAGHDIHYGQDWLERFESFVSVLRLTGLALGGFLLFAALFIVSNTIRLTFYARRDELEIMALVGATERFIKTPFLLEGALQGLFGGLLALLALTLIFKGILVEIVHSLWVTPAAFSLLFLNGHQQLILVFGGVLLGVFGSLTSLKKLIQI